MDCTEAEENLDPVDGFGIQDSTQSSDNFQKFIYELFDKNGVINDLRAYLRGHIINILKSAETGDLPVCQKNFAQRLELPFQALNILIVEYLLTMEFNYTISVFVSEVPLANMVFNFTKNLLNPETESKVSNLRFDDGDIWSVLNCIGLKCSSEHALKIVEMYKNEKRPLLFCILKCVSLYHGAISDQSSVQSSDATDDKVYEPRGPSHKCRHYVFCKACQYRVARLKEKYKWNKAKMAKNAKRDNIKTVNVETFMSNVSVLEQNLIDEMFQELKTVYETEMEMVKEEQQKRLKHSIASHALQMQGYKEKMERSFQERETALSQAIQRKKRFLWGLARSLREQHEHLTRAMAAVREQSDRLTQKESSLKTQLEEAENALKKRGEDMRQQISEELVILEEHLENMKRERDSINEQRKEMENEDTKEKYDVIKNEVMALRKYMESVRVKRCVADRGTNTEREVTVYNNEVGGKNDWCRVRHLVNDLKIRKNVNYPQTNFEEVYDVSGRSTSSEALADTEESRNDCRINVRKGGETRGRGNRDQVRDREELGDVRGLDVEELRQENNKLKNFARQQRDYIQALVNERDRLERALVAPLRPRTAPSLPDSSAGPRIDVSASGLLSRRLAVEERRVVSDPWRPRHVSNISETSKRRDPLEVSSGLRPERDLVYHQYGESPPRATYHTFPEPSKSREKSPKSMLREAKERLRNSTAKPNPPQPDIREKSPTSTLREAKLRLRKLEIEAEAVEKSYQDYRKRQEMRGGREGGSHGRDVKIKSHGIYGRQNYKRDINETSESMKKDFDKYLKEYNTFDLGRLRFNNKNSVLENVQPIPKCFSNRRDVNYLETPMTEFRKYYQVERDGDKLNKDSNSGGAADISDPEMSEVTEKSHGYKNKNDNLLSRHITNNNLITNDANLEKDSRKTSPDIQRPEQTIDNRCNKDNGNKFIDDNIEISPKDNTREQSSPRKIDSYPKTKQQNKYEKSPINDVVLSPEPKSIDKLSENHTKEIKSPKKFTIIDEPTDLIDENIKIQITENNIKVYNNAIEENEDKNNLLLVEVENEQENVIAPENHEFLVVIESSVDNRDLDAEQKYPISVVVSPKNTGPKDMLTPRGYSRRLSLDTQKDAVLSYDSDKKLSSIDLDPELSKGKVESISEVGKDSDEYLDDFSADVDNYNNTSDNGKNSPISLPRTSEDDRFWES
ncbi:uncharacterized protein LOC116774242 isoform X2 [Danaus plexippus]|uniref:uncharacterized protein LOC116774242 isoform X2 n=1 Tax=Danaus plexippus TaxID=13037 RepID=UPI002AB0CB67|nr:uncharacterized protein LOC116774242 isoform X2 [Danaus plexippus]